MKCGKGRKEPGNGGFLLLEALPALLLLAALIIVVMRLHATGLRASRLAQQDELRQQALLSVWKQWEQGDSLAALVWRTSDGAWELTAFPDSSWLPEQEGGGREPSAHQGQTFTFRRGLRRSTDGGIRWDIEFHHAAEAEWYWWSSFPEGWENHED
jgi:hypothetical protein